MSTNWCVSRTSCCHGVRAVSKARRGGARAVTAAAVLDDDLFSNFFPSIGAERDVWESMSRQMQAMEKEANHMLASSRLAQEAERTRFLQEMKPNAPGSGFSYYTEQHSSHFHSYSSVTVWSSTQGAASTVDSGVNWIAMAVMAVVGVYLAIGAAFWARFSATRFSVASRWQLVLLWPFLLATNEKFRAEFKAALSPSGGVSPDSNEEEKVQKKDVK